jgi:acetolactate synthase-1/2/3 large subunit
MPEMNFTEHAQSGEQALGRNTWARQDMDGYRAAHAIVDVLKAAGVKRIYGQSCPTAVFLAAYAAGIEQYGYRTENAGAAIADGAARVSRRISVITAQNGPAACLLVAGLAEALKASVPVLAIVQEVPLDSADRNAFQELDHEKIFSGCTKWIRRINVAERAAEYVEKAIRTATSGRPGPVVLLVSPDVLITPIQTPRIEQTFEPEFGRFPSDRMVPTADKIDALATMLMHAERPLIVAGGGIHLSGACQALADLQAIAHLPVATTNMGKGAVDEVNPLSIGTVGNAMGTRSPAKFFEDYVRSADVVVFVGSRTNENGTAGWSLFPPSARYAQIDIDPTELGRNYPGLRLLGDARETLKALCERLSGPVARDTRARTDRITKTFKQAREAHAKEIAPMLAKTSQPLRPEQLMCALDRFDDETIWVADASYSSIWLVQFIRSLKGGTRFITPRGLAGLGWGFPMAIGAKLAQPSARVVCITGDGGFAHCWAELESAKRHGVPLILVVLNNGVLGFQINAEESRFDSHTDVCHFGPIDHVGIARACGCDGMRVSNLDELTLALDAARDTRAPYVIDVLVDPQAFPPLTAFESQLARAAQSGTIAAE